MKKIIVVLTSILFMSSSSAFAIDLNNIRITKESYDLIGVNELHKQGITGKNQTVVIIDTGVMSSHPYIKNAIIDGYCSSRFLCEDAFKKSGISSGEAKTDPNNTYFLENHGTMVAGIIGGRPNANLPGGIAKDVNIISINNFGGDEQGLILALDWIMSVKEKYNIVAINLSFTFIKPISRYSQDTCPRFPNLEDRITKLYEMGVALVAAAGNNSFYNRVGFPACFKNVFAVSATDSLGNIQDYSNISKETLVLAPSDIYTSSTASSYSMGSGTSAAAPVVVGAIALLKQAKPNSTIEEIRNALSYSKTYKNDYIWSNVPVLYLPYALDYLNNNPTNLKSVEINVSNPLVSNKISMLEETINNDKKTISNLNSKILDYEQIIKNYENLIFSLMDKNKEYEQQNSELLKKINKICNKKNKPKGC